VQKVGVKMKDVEGVRDRAHLVKHRKIDGEVAS
jgi:hypothetical protein